MNCQKCGRILGYGEHCSCEQLDVFRRQMELEKEHDEEEEILELKYKNSLKNKTDKMKKSSENSNKILDIIADFFKDMFFNFKNFNDIQENYIDKKDKSYMIVLYVLNVLISSVMVYFILSKSVVNFIFSYFSVFEPTSDILIFFTATVISMISIAAKTLCLNIPNKNNKSYEISASYIYTIPMKLIVIILTFISKFLGLILLPSIFCFEMIWLYRIFKDNEKNELKIVIYLSSLMILISSVIIILIKLIS